MRNTIYDLSKMVRNVTRKELTGILRLTVREILK